LSDFGREIAASLNHLHIEAYKLRGKLREILGAAARVAQFDCEIVALDISGLTQAIAKRL
jgi:hypothetical protein